MPVKMSIKMVVTNVLISEKCLQIITYLFDNLQRFVAIPIS